MVGRVSRIPRLPVLGVQNAGFGDQRKVARGSLPRWWATVLHFEPPKVEQKGFIPFKFPTRGAHFWRQFYTLSHRASQSGIPRRPFHSNSQFGEAQFERQFHTFKGHRSQLNGTGWNSKPSPAKEKMPERVCPGGGPQFCTLSHPKWNRRIPFHSNSQLGEPTFGDSSTL